MKRWLLLHGGLSIANTDHLAILEQGFEAWNEWRRTDALARPDLRAASLAGATLAGLNLVRADLSRSDLRQGRLTRVNLRRASLNAADLSGADLAEAYLLRADLNSARLVGADLRKADLRKSDLRRADLRGADLRDANLRDANLYKADLSDADLSGAILERAALVDTVVDGTSLSGCRVYGASVWGVDLSQVRDQANLVITPRAEPAVTVDNLEVAQFVYLLLHNEKIRGVIDTVGRKGVLILGRFTDERKAVLDAVKHCLREFDLVPMVFDWDRPTKRDLTETVQLLANMSRFVVADVTEARSIPQELSHIVPFLPSVPIRPIILAGQREYEMLEHWSGYNSVLPPFEYRDGEHLVGNVERALIAPVTEWEAGYDRAKVLAQANRDMDEALRRSEQELEVLRRENARLREQPT